MSFELGIVIGMTIISFLFAYFSVNEDNALFKWFYLILSFGFMTATIDIMKKIAVAEAMDAGVISGFETLELVMITFVLLFIILFFLFVLKEVFNMWNPKKNSFKNMNPIGD